MYVYVTLKLTADRRESAIAYILCISEICALLFKWMIATMVNEKLPFYEIFAFKIKLYSDNACFAKKKKIRLIHTQFQENLFSKFMKYCHIMSDHDYPILLCCTRSSISINDNSLHRFRLFDCNQFDQNSLRQWNRIKFAYVSKSFRVIPNLRHLK